MIFVQTIILMLNAMAVGPRVLALAHWTMSILARGLDDPEYIHVLQTDPHARARADKWLTDAETLIHMALGHAVIDALGLFRLNLIRQGSGRERLSKPVSFKRLIARFRRIEAMLEDFDWLAQRRAEKLARESPDCFPLRLGASRQSTSPAFAVEARRLLCCLHRLCRGRWIARGCAQDGGGSCARGPPLRPISDFNKSRLRAAASECAGACPR